MPRRRKYKLLDSSSSSDTDEDNKALATHPQTWNIEKLQVYNGVQSVTYQSEVAAAFKDDCEYFLLQFSYKECYSYKTFADIWQDLGFAQIFEEEENVDHLITFLENCFFQLKKYIIFSKSLFIQVGAFYMVYTIYFKQPKSGLVKVRWTLDEYAALLKLLEQVQTQTNEFPFIFNKMKLSNAFLFVAETRRWGFEPKYAYEEKHLVDNIFGHDMNIDKVKSKIYSDDFYGVKCLEDVRNEYQEGLAEYLNEHPEYKASSVFATLTLAEDLKKNCDQVEFKVDKHEDGETSGESILSKRQAIKNKALKLENDSYRTKKLIKSEEN